jgi:metallophosphoesterase (TIGR03767 family)
VLRQDLAQARSGRDDRRTGLASFVHFTDLHITDTQSPARFEYMHPFVGSAHRPRETLGPVSTLSLVNRVNGLNGGPFTGRPLDFMMTTGDNTDNHEQVELTWFLDLLNGGSITPNTGDPDRYEGVQDSGSTKYWNPATVLRDDYSEKGFPHLPGLLDTAIAEFYSPGLNVPWYCTFGNHDNTPVGTLPANIPGIEYFCTGEHKVIGKDESSSRALAAAMDKSGATIPVTELFGGSGTIRRVTPDDRRTPFSTAEFVQAHLDPANTGHGPHGHGFTQDNADGREVYYTFRIAPGITGISLDTTTLAGFGDGSIGLDRARPVPLGRAHPASRQLHLLQRLGPEGQPGRQRRAVHPVQPPHERHHGQRVAGLTQSARPATRRRHVRQPAGPLPERPGVGQRAHPPQQGPRPPR